jgi:hypothetical protein
MSRPLRLCAFFWLAVVGCSESHAVDSGVGEDCPPIGPPRCVDEACCITEAPAVAVPGCRFACPSGFTVDAICEPGASCLDLSSPCAENADCTLAIDDCCGTCGRPTLDDYDAILATRSAEHARMVCPDPGAVPCPGCASMDNPNLGAACESRVCVGYDVRQRSLSSCMSDGDCRLRTRDCCECGGATDLGSLIAIRLDGEPAYGALVCPPDASCPECAPIYPAEYEAFCAPDGQCDIRPVP